MVLEFDENTLNLIVKIGPLEEYTPSEEVKELASSCADIRQQYLHKKEELRLILSEYVDKVLSKEISRIIKKVHIINQENNNHLLR